MVTWSRTFRVVVADVASVASGILLWYISTFAGISRRTIEILLSIIAIALGIAVIVLLFRHLRAAD